MMVATLPFLFGLQQLVEGMVWIEGQAGNEHHVARYSLIYMFFTWIAWPIWAPVSAYFLERGTRRNIILLFTIAGAMLGGLQFFPYFVHDGWLTTTFLSWAVRYQDVNLLDGLVPRIFTYAIYVAVIIIPFLLVRDPAIQIFGILVAATLVITYVFFSYAYISVFCFGGALISLYLLVIMWRKHSASAAA
ncbi:hypothetical protein BN949_05026 [Agrobacterium tumefaciens]|nr:MULTISPECIES: DUF6629 family protein [Hyphomicrobiales]CDN95854.1 hypothetical protein BN949_05026 [Agrobacterium tumefaciens]